MCGRCICHFSLKKTRQMTHVNPTQNSGFCAEPPNDKKDLPSNTSLNGSGYAIFESRGVFECTINSDT